MHLPDGRIMVGASTKIIFESWKRRKGRRDSRGDPSSKDPKREKGNGREGGKGDSTIASAIFEFSTVFPPTGLVNSHQGRGAEPPESFVCKAHCFSAPLCFERRTEEEDPSLQKKCFRPPFPFPPLTKTLKKEKRKKSPPSPTLHHRGDGRSPSPTNPTCQFPHLRFAASSSSSSSSAFFRPPAQSTKLKSLLPSPPL